MKGLSHVNSGFIGMALIIIIPAVAAAASAPSSLTSTKAFCTTCDTKRPLLVPPVIPENNQNTNWNSSILGKKHWANLAAFVIWIPVGILMEILKEFRCHLLKDKLLIRKVKKNKCGITLLWSALYQKSNNSVILGEFWKWWLTIGFLHREFFKTSYVKLHWNWLRQLRGLKLLKITFDFQWFIVLMWKNLNL